jgi:polyphenol oxidase
MTTSTSRRSSSSEVTDPQTFEGRSSISLGSGLRCEIRTTTTLEGDFRTDIEPSVLEARRRGILDAEWTWLRQVHGAEVVTVSRPGEFAGEIADGAVVGVVGAPIAVTTADCAPVVLVASNAIAVVHAGWRGAEAGIVERAAGELTARGAQPVATFLGPCIGPSHYEFGQADLARLIDRFGPTVGAVTVDGAPALDLPAVIASACRQAGWPAPQRPPCTSDPMYFSHRTRSDRGRQTTVAWMEPTDGPS